jgi:hypothetical protein
MLLLAHPDNQGVLVAWRPSRAWYWHRDQDVHDGAPRREGLRSGQAKPVRRGWSVPWIAVDVAQHTARASLHPHHGVLRGRPALGAALLH